MWRDTPYNVQKCYYDDAISIIAELEDTFNPLTSLDVSDQLLHVRSLVASARICHCHEALQRWEIALRHMQKKDSHIQLSIFPFRSRISN